MKKWMVVSALVLMAGVFTVKYVRADGNTLPVLVVSSTTGQGYLYPNSPSSSNPGGVLVNSGGGLFNWSNTVITSTTSATPSQLLALPSMTIAQINALTPATTGQLVFCSNCAAFSVCVSSGSTAVQQFVSVSSGTSTSNVCK